MDSIFCKLTNSEKHVFFFASQKSSKNVNVVLCKLKKSQKIRIEFFLSLKNLRKHDLIFES